MPLRDVNMYTARQVQSHNEAVLWSDSYFLLVAVVAPSLPSALPPEEDRNARTCLSVKPKPDLRR